VEYVGEGAGGGGWGGGGEEGDEGKEGRGKKGHAIGEQGRAASVPTKDAGMQRGADYGGVAGGGERGRVEAAEAAGSASKAEEVEGATSRASKAEVVEGATSRASKALLQLLDAHDLSVYTSPLLADGWETIDDVRTLTEQELVADIGMKKGHARRLTKALQALDCALDGTLDGAGATANVKPTELGGVDSGQRAEHEGGGQGGASSQPIMVPTAVIAELQHPLPQFAHASGLGAGMRAGAAASLHARE
jgi:hypothetical protein